VKSTIVLELYTRTGEISGHFSRRLLSCTAVTYVNELLYYCAVL